MERNIEGYTNYHITNDGRVYSFNQNKWKKIHIHRGRAMIKLSDGHGNMKNRSISRLVAKAYVPNPENKPYVLHLDNNPLNNSFSNLKWPKLKICNKWQGMVGVLKVELGKEESYQ